MDHAADPGAAAGLEQVPGPQRIDLHGRRIVGGEGAVDPTQVHDHLDAL